jgi:hypothetical protein
MEAELHVAPTPPVHLSYQHSTTVGSGRRTVPARSPARRGAWRLGADEMLHDCRNETNRINTLIGRRRLLLEHLQYLVPFHVRQVILAVNPIQLE